MNRAPPPSSSFLDAFAEVGEALGGGGDVVVVLPISAIDEDARNPRRAFSAEELEGLAETIRQKGLLQPITVQPAGAEGRYRLRFGARRLRAAKLAGLSEVRALVQPGELDEADALLEQMIENEQREGLNTADLAEAVARLLALGWTQATISRRLGRPKDQIAMLASVRSMPEPLKALASSLGTRTLYELAGAWKAAPERTQAWLDARSGEPITQASARELARALTAPSPSGGGGSGGGDPDAASPRASTSSPPSAPPSRRRSRRSAGALPALVFEVTLRGRPGRLRLEQVIGPTRHVLVELDDGPVLKVPLEQIKLVRIRPA